MSVEAALAAAGRSMPASTRVRGQRARSMRPPATATCWWTAARSACPTTTAKVQDPYSLRCQPQVMGACLTQIRQAAEVLVCEANAVSDNPLVFAEDGEIISGGNFHAEPVALPPTTWRWPSPRSGRCPSGAWRC